MTSPSNNESDQHRGQTNWRLWLIGAIVVYVLVFVLLNRKTVHVSFVFFTAQASLLVALILAAALGFVAGWFTHHWREKHHH